MRYKVQPEDFAIEERIRLSLAPKGRFAVYRVRKRGVTTLSVRTQMARALGLPQSDVVFPALKDKDAVSVQHAAVRGTGPARLRVPPATGGTEGLTRNGFVAEFIGRSARPLAPADIVANRFTIVLRDLSIEEVTHGHGRIQRRIAQVAQFGLPNYFDQQRFGSLAPNKDDHIGKRILRRDAEGALRAYLTQRFVGDPEPVREFKALAADHWGDWDRLFKAAPRPSNYRSVLTYLRDHPSDGSAESATHCRKAVNLITPRLLSLYLTAYQSLLWNRIAARYLVAWLGIGPENSPSYVEIAGDRLPIYHELPAHFDREVTIPLPNHRAVYDSSPPRSGGSGDSISGLAAIVAQILIEEGLALHDLKARILKKAYLPKGQRALLLFPEDVSTSPPEPDDRFPGRSKLTLAFTLPRGSYATLVIKALSL